MHRELHAAYFKKTVETRWGKRRVRIDLVDDVFSSHQLDVGSRLLMRRMDIAKVKYDSALDVGCGYGLLGLYMAATGLAESVDGFDRDVLACDFANHNAQSNDIANARFFPAIAYENIDGPYGAVVTNLPAKAGDGVHRLILLGARSLLSPAGEVWTVVVEPLQARIDAMLDHPHIDLREKTVKGGHIVYRFAFTGDVHVPDQPYTRSSESYPWKQLTYRMDGWWGLAEFDTRSIDTDLMLALVHDHLRSHKVECAAVCQPGQGHVAVFISQCAKRIDLITQGRDVIADAATAHNLLLNHHQGKLTHTTSSEFSLQTDGQLPQLITTRLNSDVRDSTSAKMICTWFDQFPDATVITGGPAAYSRRVSELLAKQRIQTKRTLKQRGFAAMRLVGRRA